MYEISQICLFCRNSLGSGQDPIILSDNPVHITWIDQEDDLESYMADVDVFAMNSRTAPAQPR